MPNSFCHWTHRRIVLALREKRFLIAAYLTAALGMMSSARADDLPANPQAVQNSGPAAASPDFDDQGNQATKGHIQVRVVDAESNAIGARKFTAAFGPTRKTSKPIAITLPTPAATPMSSCPPRCTSSACGPASPGLSRGSPIGRTSRFRKPPRAGGNLHSAGSGHADRRHRDRRGRQTHCGVKLQVFANDSDLVEGKLRTNHLATGRSTTLRPAIMKCGSSRPSRLYQPAFILRPQLRKAHAAGRTAGSNRRHGHATRHPCVGDGYRRR